MGENYDVKFAGDVKNSAPAQSSEPGSAGENMECMPIRLIIPEEFAMYHEEIMYNSDFRATLRTLEMKLHTAEEPKYIIQITVKTCCLFYDADWCGILIADRNSGLWGPKIWYDRATDGMTPTLFHEFEYFEYFPRWVDSLNSGEPVVIQDIETIREIDPKEYENYRRLDVKGVIGAPFGENPTGFLVVRNPNRYQTYPDMVQMLAFVGLSQYYLSEFLDYSPEEAEDLKKVRINLFGVPSVVYRGTVITANDYRAPKGWKLLAYLALSEKPRAVYDIALALWPDDALVDPSENVRSTIYRIRDKVAHKVPGELIVNRSGYCLNPDLTVTTDVREMESLWEQAQKEPVVSAKVELLKRAFRLYTGEVYEAFADEEWLSHHAHYYAMMYINIVNMLLETLAGEKDYPCIQEFAGKSLQKAPGNQKAYYWLAEALIHSGATAEAKKKILNAKEELPDEDYKELVAKLKNDFGITEN